jgi:ribosomal-protein-alanine N-acetyltransferase
LDDGFRRAGNQPTAYRWTERLKVYNLSMPTTQCRTKSLVLNLLTRDETLAMIEALSPEQRAEVSDEWLAALRASDPVDPWRHGFSMVHRDTGCTVGKCGFKGPPADGVVEIAYGVEPEHQGNSYATEAAAALAIFAFAHNVPVVRAHTLPEANASTRVLSKCGFHKVGEVIDPEDGPVWRWEMYCQRDTDETERGC